MALKFNCTNCGKEMIAQHLKVGETAKCGNCGAEIAIPSTAVETGVEPVDDVRNQPLAGRGHRLGARVIDFLIFAVPWVLLLPARDDEHVFAIASLSVIFVIIVIQWILLSSEGQTIGKIVMEVKIVEVATGKNGGFVTNVLLREIVNRVVGIVPFYPLVDALFIFREDRRCIHDMIAGTRVVRAK